MLKNLHIENIAVIQRADVEFMPGMNVLTGETGAGKSIIIDSLNAVLGGRVSKDLIRAGAENGRVAAAFSTEGTDEWCRENDIEPEEELILQRRINGDGKSSARINGIPVSAAQLRELGSLLLDIHGQNDGRRLLDEKNHLRYLDSFGVPSSAVSEYKAAYEKYRSLVREAEKLRMDENEKAFQEDSLSRKITELENANIRSGEEAELTERRDMLHNSEKLTEFLETAVHALYDSDDSAVAQSGEAEYAVERAAAWSPSLSDCTELIHSARMSLEDAAERVREVLDQLDFSPEEYDRIEERLSLLRRLQRKYSTDEEGLIALLEESRKKRDELEFSEERLEQLKAEISASCAAAKKAAQKLSSERKKAGEALQTRVEKELRDLSMPSVKFCVTVEPLEGSVGLDSNGMDTVYFTMSANAGEKPGPISRIASGGELSRIMLALKTVFSESDPVDTMVFDEIDTGVSGIAAQRVGEKMSSLSRRKQVLCVTHLPQIAALADEQYLVRKQEKDGRTYTEIRQLDFDGRCHEIARLTGGDVITEMTLGSASEMIHHAEDYRRSLTINK